ncbi:hypothetical protein BDW02DRAFT_648840 [Decorospora gaudefroyi]|uniref:Uncharacterized protein n=1 Tax=Decorospora gaudefroyi TaxID=184978 RepID=A0A6A5K859_9PLEO|nr:hypothetical protein BDW02DRAFT_648840 [Decorospora gaudefroyi]
MPAPSTTFLHRTTLISSAILLLLSLTTLGLTGHANWLLEKYFPGSNWYLWRVAPWEEDQRQKWVAVTYNATYDRLTIMRAAVGVVAGVLGLCTARVVDIVAEVPYAQPSTSSLFRLEYETHGTHSNKLYTLAMNSARIAFVGTLISAIWSCILQYLLSEKCHLPMKLDEYSNKFQCTREVAACAMLGVVTRDDERVRVHACVETVHLARKHAAMDRRADGRVACLLEKAE